MSIIFFIHSRSYTWDDSSTTQKIVQLWHSQMVTNKNCIMEHMQITKKIGLWPFYYVHHAVRQCINYAFTISIWDAYEQSDKR